jgi:hypothetical protein
VEKHEMVNLALPLRELERGAHNPFWNEIDINQ